MYFIQQSGKRFFFSKVKSSAIRGKFAAREK